MNIQDSPSYLKTCDRVLAITSKTMTSIAILALAAMTILIAMQVISRNILNIGLPWADELARFTGLCVVFFTIPMLQYHGRHIAVDIISSKLRGLSGKLLNAVNETLVFAFCILLIISFYDFLQRAAHFSTPAIGMPNWIFYAPALLGILTCTVITGLKIIKIFSAPAKATSCEEQP